jgi:hypothetical protein
MLKPDTFLDEDLATVSHAARWLFAALWTIADREGRLEDRPQRIRAQAFPYEPGVDIEGLLSELAKAKENGGTFLTRYESGGVKVIQLTNFAKHQKPHIREAVSVLPTPSLEKPGKGTPRQCRAGERTPVPVSVPVSDPVRTEQPVQPPSSPSVDSRTDADDARSDLREALQDLRRRQHAFAEKTDQAILDCPVFHAPTGPVRIDSCANEPLLRATVGKIRAYGQPKPRKVTAPAFDRGTTTYTDAEVMAWDPRLGPKPEALREPAQTRQTQTQEMQP